MRLRQLAQAALCRGARVASWDGPSANLQKVVSASLDSGGRKPANLPKVSRLRRQKGNLANWHGFGGGQLPMALVVPPEMQICTSEIAAVNPPMGGICRDGHRSAKLHNGVQAPCRLGGCATLRILVQMASG